MSVLNFTWNITGGGAGSLLRQAPGPGLTLSLPLWSLWQVPSTQRGHGTSVCRLTKTLLAKKKNIFPMGESLLFFQCQAKLWQSLPPLWALRKSHLEFKEFLKHVFVSSKGKSVLVTRYLAIKWPLNSNCLKAMATPKILLRQKEVKVNITAVATVDFTWQCIERTIQMHVRYVRNDQKAHRCICIKANFPFFIFSVWLQIHMYQQRVSFMLCQIHSTPLLCCVPSAHYSNRLFYRDM